MTQPELSNPPQLEPRLAAWVGRSKRSLLRQLVEVVARPGVLSLAGGLPATELFPTEAYGRALVAALRDRRSLQYGPAHAPLKRHIVELMRRRGVTCDEDQILLTTGAQQALDLLGRLFLDAGTPAVLEEAVYTGIRQVVRTRDGATLPIRTDLETGLDLGDLERHLEGPSAPGFVYVIPDAHNPLGVSLASEKRRPLVDLARRHGLPIIEDDAYGLLSYDGAFAPPLRALDSDWVIYVGSFSKIIAPGLRLGWMVVPSPLLPRLTLAKEAADLESSSLTQRAVAILLDELDMDEHLQCLHGLYRERRDAMLEALGQHFPQASKWTRPKGGMFIWVELPPQIDGLELLNAAVEREQVAFVPGSAFTLDSQPTSSLRLSFSAVAPPDIHEGVARLGGLLERRMATGAY